tara:strand:- start:395 stop:580 length:186 start_codon:yes stop_codon:yes gene_type:complete
MTKLEAKIILLSMFIVLVVIVLTFASLKVILALCMAFIVAPIVIFILGLIITCIIKITSDS